jgi:CTP synthase
MTETKFIFVTGGVLSGLGKGITTASLGKLLQGHGYSVTAVKIDPYLNRDAGTMRPTEHGEVWVTEDGGEIDQDLGNYERFLGIILHKNHNITSGKVYWEVLNKERRGEYLGKTVQPIPQVIDEINKMILDVAKEDKTDFVLIEVGGQVGDYENILFLEAARQLRFDHKVMFVHIGYLPIPKHLGEMKTKPLQHSIIALRGLGIIPDIVIGRGEKEMDDHRKMKIAFTCGIPKKKVFSNPDVESVYSIPTVFKDQGMDKVVLDFFGLEGKENCIKEWENYVQKISSLTKKIKIGIVGKYFDIGDFNLVDSYISVIEAVKHAAWNNDVSPEIVWIDAKKYEDDPSALAELKSMDCVIVPGGFGKSGIEGKILTAKFCREQNIPYLGLCLGLQIAVTEFARNICKLDGANSTEFNPDTKYPVVAIIEEQKEILKKQGYGATMRLGGWKALLKEGSLVQKLYGGKKEVIERHRHRFEVNPKFISQLEEKGLVFSGKSEDGVLMEFLELPKHKFYIATQAHPEFTSRPMKPNPLFDGLIKAGITTK